MPKSSFGDMLLKDYQWGSRWGEHLGEALPGLFSGLASWVSTLFERLFTREHTEQEIILAVGKRWDDAGWMWQQPIRWEHHRLQNGHLLVTGGSGCGKTALLYSLATQLMGLPEEEQGGISHGPTQP